jgi:hypothetical protein
MSNLKERVRSLKEDTFIEHWIRSLRAEVSTKERAWSLTDAVIESRAEYSQSKNRRNTQEWVRSLGADAIFN